MAALSIALASAAGAADWYVRTDGSDAGDGTNWLTAFQTISNGVAHAASNDTVWVSNGLYAISVQISLTNAIAIRGFGGGQAVVNGGGSVRCFNLTHPAAMLDGLVVSNGYVASTGGGISMTAGTVQNCLVVGNKLPTGGLSGNGIYMSGGMVSNCVIRNNDSPGSQDNYAGGVHIAGGTLQYSTIVSNRAFGSNRTAGGGVLINGGVVRNCLIAYNEAQGASGDYGASSGGGGVKLTAGTLRNCIVFGNVATAGHVDNKGGGVRITGGVMDNCTIVRNAAAGTTGGGGGVYRDGGTITNCIVCYNTTLAGTVNIAAGSAFFSDAPELTNGAGNITADPGFTAKGSGSGLTAVYGDYRLLPRGPCVDAGTNLAAVTFDYEGTFRPLDGNADGSARHDLGAYEDDPANGPLRCNIFASTNFGFGSVTSVFTAYVEGANTNGLAYYWDFDNNGVIDTNGADLAVVTNTYVAGGLYSVGLTVSNVAPAGFTLVKPNLIAVLVDADAYVSPGGSHTSPFDTWGKAATNIQTAVDMIQALVAGGGTHRTVWITNGIYTVGVPVSLTADVTVSSTNGPLVTVVNGNAATRCFSVDSPGAVLAGLTISNGLWTSDGSGLQLNNGTVTNCVITRCQNFRAVNMVGGTLAGCSIVNNTAGNGGGLYLSGGTTRGCTITNNVTTAFGAGVYMTAGTLADSTMAANLNVSAGGTGHGLYMTAGMATNCMIRGNGGHVIDTYAGGVYLSGGSLLGCTVVSNQAWGDNRNTGGGVWINGAGAVVDRCQILFNEAKGAPAAYIDYNGGGGVTIHDGILRNCLIAGNLANGNHSSHLGGGVRMKGGRIENCTIVRNAATNQSDAAGVYWEGGTLTNCIVTFNATRGGGTITNIVAGNSKYSCAPELTNGPGNIVGDPQFKDAGAGAGLAATLGDYRLKTESPCVDNGTNLAWMAGSVDLGGQRRLVRIADMGAYETPSPKGTIFMVH